MRTKLSLILLLLVASYSSFGQISVSPRHIGGSKNFKKGTLEDFKKTTTIFVLSNVYSPFEYEKILESSWTVTPFEIVPIYEFDVKNYIGGNYSIATLEGYKKTMSNGGSGGYSFLHAYIDVYMFDTEKLKKKLSSLKKKTDERIYDAIEDNRINIARVELFPKDEFIATTMTQKISEAVVSMFSEDVFYNYYDGFLKNYFQQISKAIETEQTLWMYESDSKPGLRKLKSGTLYVPEYAKIRYNPWKGLDDAREEPEALFKRYDFKYEFISENELNKKIMAGEDIYYLRYVRVNSQKFIHVVSAKDGDMLYQEYVPGTMSYNLKSKHIADISRKISKASKK